MRGVTQGPHRWRTAVLRRRNYPPAVYVLWIMNFKSSSRAANARSPRIIRCTHTPQRGRGCIASPWRHGSNGRTRAFRKKRCSRDRNASEWLYRSHFRYANASSVNLYVEIYMRIRKSRIYPRIRKIINSFCPLILKLTIV